MSSEKSSNTGFLLGLLGIAFVVLKLCKVINWSWWWVTIPFWGGMALVLALLALAGLGWIAKTVYKENFRKNERVKYPVKSKWQERLEEIKAQQIKIREQNAKHN